MLTSEIVSDYHRTLKEKDYILDNTNYYDVPSNTIHITGTDFIHNADRFTLLHELAHRYQCLNKIEYVNVEQAEDDANAVAIVCLSRITYINKYTIEKLLKRGTVLVPQLMKEL